MGSLLATDPRFRAFGRRPGGRFAQVDGACWGDGSPRSLTFATLFGIASSSCSYAAVALGRSLLLKGASFTAAMVFELDSSNLVIEVGVILVVLMGWPFAAAEFSGGIIMVVLLALICRLTLTPRLVKMGTSPGRKGAGRTHGGTRWHGHEHRGWVGAVAAVASSRPNCHQPLLCHGLGVRLDGRGG